MPEHYKRIEENTHTNTPFSRDSSLWVTSNIHWVYVFTFPAAPLHTKVMLSRFILGQENCASVWNFRICFKFTSAHFKTIWRSVWGICVSHPISSLPSVPHMFLKCIRNKWFYSWSAKNKKEAGKTYACKRAAPVLTVVGKRESIRSSSSSSSSRRPILILSLSLVFLQLLLFFRPVVHWTLCPHVVPERLVLHSQKCFATKSPLNGMHSVHSSSLRRNEEKKNSQTESGYSLRDFQEQLSRSSERHGQREWEGWWGDGDEEEGDGGEEGRRKNREKKKTGTRFASSLLPYVLLCRFCSPVSYSMTTPSQSTYPQHSLCFPLPRQAFKPTSSASYNKGHYVPKVDEREKGRHESVFRQEEATILLTGISERMMSPSQLWDFATKPLWKQAGWLTTHPDTKTRLFSFEKERRKHSHMQELRGRRTVGSQEQKQQHMG